VLIGKEEGDTVTMKTGKGTREYQIAKVSFEYGDS
jgi:transcription elongation GreA/GreB family factor